MYEHTLLKIIVLIALFVFISYHIYMVFVNHQNCKIIYKTVVFYSSATQQYQNSHDHKVSGESIGGHAHSEDDLKDAEGPKVPVSEHSPDEWTHKGIGLVKFFVIKFGKCIAIFT